MPHVVALVVQCVRLLLKCDRQFTLTHRWTDRQMPDKVIPISRLSLVYTL